MKILLLDNFDSFTYNLLHLIEQFDGIAVDVFRNNEITVEDVKNYDRIIISPGPGLPVEAGITNDLIRKYHSTKPILGVCLGMQALAEVCGAKLFNLPVVFHGISEDTIIVDSQEKIFTGIPSTFKSGRYHSWAVDTKDLPACLHITAIDQIGNIMALTHQNLLLRGLQFHPESILTQFGKILMSNWLVHC